MRSLVFYTYFRGECDACTTTSITIPRLMFSSSGNAIQAFSLMGYKILDDVEIDQKPKHTRRIRQNNHVT